MRTQLLFFNFSYPPCLIWLRLSLLCFQDWVFFLFPCNIHRILLWIIPQYGEWTASTKFTPAHIYFSSCLFLVMFLCVCVFFFVCVCVCMCVGVCNIRLFDLKYIPHYYRCRISTSIRPFYYPIYRPTPISPRLDVNYRPSPCTVPWPHPIPSSPEVSPWFNPAKAQSAP